MTPNPVTPQQVQRPKPTTEQVHAALNIAVAVAEMIRECGADGCPSGPLYAALMGKLQISLDTYTRLIDSLKNAGLVKESGHVLYWKGSI